MKIDENGNQTQMQTARHEDEMLLEENAVEYNMGYNLRSRKGPLYLNSPSVEKPQIQGKKVNLTDSEVSSENCDKIAEKMLAHNDPTTLEETTATESTLTNQLIASQEPEFGKLSIIDENASSHSIGNTRDQIKNLKESILKTLDEREKHSPSIRANAFENSTVDSELNEKSADGISSKEKEKVITNVKKEKTASENNFVDNDEDKMLSDRMEESTDGEKTQNVVPDVIPDIDSINLAEKLAPNQCKLCFSEFSSFSNLMRHNETVHKDDHEVLGLKRFTLKDLVHSCDICPLGFLTENILINHKKLKHRMEVKKSKEECKECGKVIKNYGLKKHMLTHRKGSEKRTTLNCEKCNKVVKTKNYKSHLLTHGDKQYECNLCYRMFSIPKYLWKHQKQVHVTDAHLVNKPINEENLQFECNYCKKRFVSSNILRYHSKDHSENGHGLLTKEKKKNRSARKRLRLQCKLCYSKFKGVSNLNSHIDEAHAEDIHLVTDNIKEEDKVFGCDECELRFITENVLKYHKSKPHGGKYVRCKICSKITRRDRVEAHQRRHSGRNHTCLLCYSSFQSQDFLKKHEEKSHTSDREKDFLLNGMGDFTFSCTKCELKFLTDSLLQSHLRKHKAEALIKQRNDKFEHLKKECYNKDDKKYQCKLCYIRYKEFGSLSAHFDTVHGDEIELILKQLSESDFTLQCDVCLLKFVSKLSKDIHMSKLHDDESESNFASFATLNLRTLLDTGNIKFKFIKMS